MIQNGSGCTVAFVLGGGPILKHINLYLFVLRDSEAGQGPKLCSKSDFNAWRFGKTFGLSSRFRFRTHTPVRDLKML